MKFVPRRLERTAEISSGKTKLSSSLKVAAIVAASLIAAWFLVGVVADGIAERITAETEARWFGGLGETLAAGGEETKTPDLERAERILGELLEAGDLRALPFRLVELDDDAPNALAAPGGLVGVTRGLLDRVRSERGLAMVLAHELGHHHHRHTLRRVGRALALQALLALVDGGAALEQSVGLAEASYSRDQEREADRFGLELVHRAYGGLDGALEFFELVEEEEREAWTDFTSSHPLTSKRLEELREFARELETR